MRSGVLLAFFALISTDLAAQTMALRPFEAEGLQALNRGDFASCARTFAQAARVHAAEPSPAFVAARCYARLGDADGARTHLELALQRGYRQCANVAGEPGLAAFADLLRRCEANEDRYLRESNAELLAAYLADRADRTGEIGGVEAVLARDARRRDVVRIAMKLRALRTADDYYHAAYVMQHGSTAEDYALARDLARRAAELRPWFADARWLHAAATDRHLQSVGKPQIFGTQYQRDASGTWTLEPFDAGAITDEERARWRVPSLQERRRFIEQLNRAAQ